ncbi:MAG: glycosyltransferase family 2 protein [Candidatus Omnitrophota bacterium]
MLIAAYNEEKYIEEKIESILALDYPTEKIEILIGSDGSVDKTDEIVSKFVNNRLSLFRQQIREGKPLVLNSLVSHAKNEILVFSDARQRLDKNCLKHLVVNFSDKTIGSVSAQLIFQDDGGNKGIGLYWNYEKFIRNSESKLASMLGATGALYAIRKELFTLLPENLILDDVYIPLKVVEKNYRAIFEPRAIIYDHIAESPKGEFLRKVRTLAGNFQIFGLLKGLFNPFKSSVAFQLFSHKFLRLTVPYLLVCLFISNIFILNNAFLKTFFYLQVIFYSLAFFGIFIKRTSKLIDIANMFCVMNWAAVVGLYGFLTHKQEVAWEKTS